MMMMSKTRNSGAKLASYGASHRGWRWLGAVGVVAALSCGGPATPTQVVVNNTVQVTISDGPNAGKPPSTIDMGDKRISVAFEAIAKLIGHGVQFEIDNSLIPKFDDRLHEAFIEALETLVTSLEYTKKYYPEATTFCGPHLQVIRWTYSPSKGDIDTELDTSKNRLDVPVPADEWRLLPDSLIAGVFDDAWDKEKEHRYTTIAPEAVPVAEQAFYLDFVKSYHRPPPGETEVDKEKREIARLGKILALYSRLQDPEVKEKARDSLSYGGRDLRDWFAKLGEMPELAGPLVPVHRAWIAWLNADFETLSEVKQRDLTSLVFTRSYQPAPGFGVGVDVVKLVTPRIRQWLARPPEKERHSYGPPDAVIDFMVCPFDSDPGEHRFSGSSQSCNGLVYTTLTEKGYQPLVSLLRSVKAPALAQTAVLNLLNQRGPDAAAGLVDALWADKDLARGALVALAEFEGWGNRNRRSELPELGPKPFIDRIPGWWRAHPDFHGELLYLTVTLGDEYEGTVVWPKLSDYLGSRLTGAEVAGFLQQSPRTIWYLRLFVHSLSDGWSRSKTMIPELERFLNDVNASGRGEPSPYYVTERCVQFLCITGNSQDIAALQKFLKDRIERYPSEQRSLASFTDSSSQQCPGAKAEAAREAKGAKAGVTFGD